MGNLAFASTDDGVELPVIDVTHPSFPLKTTADERRAALARFMSEPQPLEKLPAFLQRALLRLLLRGSVLAEGIRSSEGTFLSGMRTYLLKLGPDNLGSWAKPIDRKIAAALPSRAVGWRLYEVARMLANAVREACRAGTERVHLIDIAGGPAIDALDALILAKDAIGSLEVTVSVLDLDAHGPSFGARALEALKKPGGALEGVDATLRHVPYDWSRAEELRAFLAREARESPPTAGSSEGGLFEYGSDDEILRNLEALRDGTPAGFVMVGSVTRDDEAMRRLRRIHAPATRPRGLDVFTKLAERAGWRVAEAVEGPFSDQVALRKTG